MPNLDFYATGSDFDPLLEYLFEQSGCRVFESYSGYDTYLREFKTPDALKQAFDIGNCKKAGHAACLMLVPPGAQKLFKIEKILLLPTTGHSYRYRVAGWGLIQLYLGGIGANGLLPSHTNHNSEKRAQKWEGAYPKLGRVLQWDWNQVSKNIVGYKPLHQKQVGRG